MRCGQCNERFNYEIIGSGEDNNGNFTDVRCEECDAVSRIYDEYEEIAE